ncbi:MAG TPA: L-histidine N(alpha)-methyltransferase [Allosphingosinicella sp.]|nr:L-histidine N(alpha)-methyltransferase [Allosphingosinicella sp.]
MSELITEVLDDFALSVVAGLALPQKALAPRFFYDHRGSELFEEITRQPEYYLTRTELRLLEAHGGDIARLAGINCPVVEFGAGSARKTPLLLDAVQCPLYVPIDISADYLAASSAALAHDHPKIEVMPIAADFTRPLDLPKLRQPVIGFFPGSTLGNFSHAAAAALLRSFRDTLGSSARLVIGLDTLKNPRLLEAAYDDAAGITAQFNLNLLHRINRELDGTIDVDAFEHRAWWHDGFGRIEMHLLATRDLSFKVAGYRFSMREGETIHTENSHKYSLDEARLLARVAGWEPMAGWTDSESMFSLHVWAAAPDDSPP